MANNLTGDYDAVAQVTVRAVNGIIATLHQNGVSKDASPSFLHSISVNVGEAPSRITAELWQVAKWAYLALGNQQEKTVRSLAKKSPPGVSVGLAETLGALKEAQAGLTTPVGVRGFAQVQLSTPSVSFPSGSTSDLTGRVTVRANYVPNSNTLPLPEPVHGNVEIALSVQVVAKSGFNTEVVEVSFPQDDSGIQFTPAPGTGLTPSEVNTITAQIRSIVRSSFEPTNVELPQGFEFNRFKALGSGGGQVLALPVQLSNTPSPPPSALNAVNTNFLAQSDDFGVAVGREFVLSMIQPQLDAIKSSHPQFTVSSWIGTATYTTNFTQAQASWVNGKIHLSIQGNSTTPTWWAPNVGSFSIQQDLVLAFDAGTQSLAVNPQGQPSVNVNVNGPFGGLIEGSVKPVVRNAFIAERDKALNQAQSDIQQVFNGAGSVNDALKAFDSATHAEYKSLTTNQDGFVLHGRITTRWRYPEPIVQVNETGDGEGFSALKSWIPAGVVEKFRWSWLEAGHPYIPWSQTTKTVSEEHRFILPKPDGISHSTQICLYVEGKQVYPGHMLGTPPNIGQRVNAEGGDTCSASGPEFVFVMPAWWEKIFAPIWLPDPPPEAVLAESISAHVEAISPNPGEWGANTVVHFADLGEGKPFDSLNQGLAGLRNNSMPMALALVLPQGSFDQSRRELERQLGALTEFNGKIVITEDYQSGWANTFGTDRAPATYLTNARGEFVWQQAGGFDAAAFSRALSEHMIAAPPPRSRALSLSVKVGDKAPDILMESLSGDRLALRKLRGRAIVLLFWQSWSEPCVRELLRLQRINTESTADTPILVAVHVGGSRDELEEFVRRHEVDMALVADSQRQIAKRYGVRCWPTTVSIDRGGIVNNIKFGVTHLHGVR